MQSRCYDWESLAIAVLKPYDDGKVNSLISNHGYKQVQFVSTHLLRNGSFTCAVQRTSPRAFCGSIGLCKISNALPKTKAPMSPYTSTCSQWFAVHTKDHGVSLPMSNSTLAIPIELSRLFRHVPAAHSTRRVARSCLTRCSNESYSSGVAQSSVLSARDRHCRASQDNRGSVFLEGNRICGSLGGGRWQRDYQP